ncbi:hypothetical protein GMLC_22030 [Geomonas limicola]|uniref:Tellurium resistance protein TerC n=1 Tax=Geomonas limicola TaxID=2740186 RepID=A0A6V8N9R6_9BACT|nr:PGPGW domain-containing protein [Geomonas limicola]GFO68624.1 hypothetical protein GMLC_22030 [Geomonas limicola]
MLRLMKGTLGQAKRAVVAIVGGTVLLIGIALVVLPGPAFLVIPVGLAILASEFLWARKLLEVLRTRLESWKQGKEKSNSDR